MFPLNGLFSMLGVFSFSPPLLPPPPSLCAGLSRNQLPQAGGVVRLQVGLRSGSEDAFQAGNPESPRTATE